MHLERTQSPNQFRRLNEIRHSLFFTITMTVESKWYLEQVDNMTDILAPVEFEQTSAYTQLTCDQKEAYARLTRDQQEAYSKLSDSQQCIMKECLPIAAREGSRAAAWTFFVHCQNNGIDLLRSAYPFFASAPSYAMFCILAFGYIKW